jgi:hypothetical protein
MNDPYEDPTPPTDVRSAATKVKPEPGEQRLVARVRGERDRRIIDYAAEMLATLCHPLRERNDRRRRGPT